MTSAYREDPEKNNARASAWYYANPERARATRKAYRDANRAKRAEYNRRWRAANLDKVRANYAVTLETRRARHTVWRRANPDKVRATARAWDAANPGKMRASRRAWRQANPGKARALLAKYRADKDQRTPPWVDLKKIEQVYVEAQAMTQMMGEPWHVDHVIPLRGRNVSGLHVYANLQLLSGVENDRKGNRYDLSLAA